MVFFRCVGRDRESQASYSKTPLTMEANHVEKPPAEAEVLLMEKGEARQPSFLRCLLRVFGPYFLIGSAYKLLQDLITFINPVLLR